MLWERLGEELREELREDLKDELREELEEEFNLWLKRCYYCSKFCLGGGAWMAFRVGVSGVVNAVTKELLLPRTAVEGGVYVGVGGGEN